MMIESSLTTWPPIGHYHVYETGQVLHRDISENNLMIFGPSTIADDESEGKLDHSVVDGSKLLLPPTGCVVPRPWRSEHPLITLRNSKLSEMNKGRSTGHCALSSSSRFIIGELQMLISRIFFTRHKFR